MVLVEMDRFPSGMLMGNDHVEFVSVIIVTMQQGQIGRTAEQMLESLEW